jgi:hypothetical protein
MQPRPTDFRSRSPLLAGNRVDWTAQPPTGFRRRLWRINFHGSRDFKSRQAQSEDCGYGSIQNASGQHDEPVEARGPRRDSQRAIVEEIETGGWWV